jgi:short-subunit dehydrogenase
MITSLDERTALVTGIGRAIARELARADVSIAVVARSQEELAETGERIWRRTAPYSPSRRTG